MPGSPSPPRLPCRLIRAGRAGGQDFGRGFLAAETKTLISKDLDTRERLRAEFEQVPRPRGSANPLQEREVWPSDHMGGGIEERLPAAPPTTAHRHAAFAAGLCQRRRPVTGAVSGAGSGP